MLQKSICVFALVFASGCAGSPPPRWNPVAKNLAFMEAEKSKLNAEERAKYEASAVQIDFMRTGLSERAVTLEGSGPNENRGWRLTRGGQPVQAEVLAQQLRREQELGELPHVTGPDYAIAGVWTLVGSASSLILGGVLATSDAEDAALPALLLGTAGAITGAVLTVVGIIHYTSSDHAVPLDFGADLATDHNAAITASLLAARQQQNATMSSK